MILRISAFRQNSRRISCYARDVLPGNAATRYAAKAFRLQIGEEAKSHKDMLTKPVDEFRGQHGITEFIFQFAIQSCPKGRLIGKVDFIPDDQESMEL